MIDSDGCGVYVSVVSWRGSTKAGRRKSGRRGKGITSLGLSLCVGCGEAERRLGGAHAPLSDVARARQGQASKVHRAAKVCVLKSVEKKKKKERDHGLFLSCHPSINSEDDQNHHKLSLSCHLSINSGDDQNQHLNPLMILDSPCLVIFQSTVKMIKISISTH